MSGPLASFAARLKTLPDGALLRSVFYGLVGVATFLVAMDFRELVNDEAAGPFAMPAQSPVLMDRPERDNQIRPYLPFTRPVAPDEDGIRLRGRPREENEAAPMHFRLGTHGSAFAEGTITPGTAESLVDFLESDRAAGVTEIVLHSPGGSVTDATEMARTIREHGLATRVLADGYCASSCPLVFAGGTERIAHATSWIGVHQVFALTTSFGSLGEGMDHAQRVSAETQDMLFEFGVDPRVWTRAMATAKEHLYLFTPDELLDLKLATKIEGSAEDPVAAARS
jgi:hypothetical protein